MSGWSCLVGFWLALAGFIDAGWFMVGSVGPGWLLVGPGQFLIGPGLFLIGPGWFLVGPGCSWLVSG